MRYLPLFGNTLARCQGLADKLPMRWSKLLNFFAVFVAGSKIRLVTLDVTIMLVRQLVIADQKSFLTDDHFAQVGPAHGAAVTFAPSHNQSTNRCTFLHIYTFLLHPSTENTNFLKCIINNNFFTEK